MNYTEIEMLEVINRLGKFYLESYPHDRATVDCFLRWCYSQYGYIYKGSDL